MVKFIFKDVFFLCFTSAVSNKLYYTADEPYFQTNAPSIDKKINSG